MKNFYLVANPQKDGTREMAENIRQYLEDIGCVCRIRAMTEEAPYTKDANRRTKAYLYTDASKVPEDTECIITLGGDGTLIQAARDLAGREIPMFGINMGNVGYLTQAGGDLGTLSELFKELFNDEYQLERRMMLKGQVIRDDEAVMESFALNEVVIARREVLKVLHLKVSVNGEYLNTYQSDGVIMATPTGSTGYNLSSGGPIVEPTAKMMILTPVCSHALNGRSIVLSSEDIIEVEVLGDDDSSQAVVFDGDTFMNLRIGDKVRVTRSEVATVLVKCRTGSFLDNLRSKLAGI